MLTPKLPTSLLIAPILLAASVSGAGAAAGKQCRLDCRSQGAACVESFREDFVAAEALCADRACRRETRRSKQADTKRCRVARHECTACCRESAAGRCDVEVHGDGLCGGRVEPIEQCDGRDDEACPGACENCRCPDGSVVPWVGMIEAGSMVLTFVDDAPGTTKPFETSDGFVIDVGFATGADLVTAWAPASGCTVSRVDVLPASASWVGLDAGATGQASTGDAVTELIRLVSLGRMTPVDQPARLAAAGFGHGSEVQFSFSGGADIAAFETSLVVPSSLDLRVPDVRDPSLRLDFSRSLELAWAPGGPDATIRVSVQALTPTEHVVARCSLADTGAGEIAADVMAQVPADANLVDLTVFRVVSKRITVPLTRGGSGSVDVEAYSGVRWRNAKVSTYSPG